MPSCEAANLVVSTAANSLLNELVSLSNKPGNSLDSIGRASSLCFSSGLAATTGSVKGLMLCERLTCKTTLKKQQKAFVDRVTGCMTSIGLTVRQINGLRTLFGIHCYVMTSARNEQQFQLKDDHAVGDNIILMEGWLFGVCKLDDDGNLCPIKKLTLRDARALLTCQIQNEPFKTFRDVYTPNEDFAYWEISEIDSQNACLVSDIKPDINMQAEDCKLTKCGHYPEKIITHRPSNDGQRIESAPKLDCCQFLCCYGEEKSEDKGIKLQPLAVSGSCSSVHREEVEVQEEPPENEPISAQAETATESISCMDRYEEWFVQHPIPALLLTSVTFGIPLYSLLIYRCFHKNERNSHPR